METVGNVELVAFAFLMLVLFAILTVAFVVLTYRMLWGKDRVR